MASVVIMDDDCDDGCDAATVEYSRDDFVADDDGNNNDGIL